eukprot:GEZU01004014.1.p1 GENE.GEZU01004014.1~~GEZU01004014.1.p1  ORF type:complete len:643 (+),score=163.27 GEZU01004014.1:131-2059(+)
MSANNDNTTNNNPKVEPEKLTIQQLKSKIAEHGYSDQLPTSDVTKPYYVYLYKKHVLKMNVGEFKEEEHRTPKKTSSNKKRKTQPTTPEVTEIKKKTRIEDESDESNYEDEEMPASEETKQGTNVRPAMEASTSAAATGISTSATAPADTTTTAAITTTTVTAASPISSTTTTTAKTTPTIVSEKPVTRATRPATQINIISTPNKRPPTRRSDVYVPDRSSQETHKMRRRTIATSNFVNERLLSSPPQYAQQPAPTTPMDQSTFVDQTIYTNVTQYSNFDRSSLNTSAAPKGPCLRLLTSLVAFIVILLFSFLIYAAIIAPIYHTPPKPYCDSEVGLIVLGGSALDDLVQQQGQPCVPCPAHGYCADKKLLQCQPGYVIKNYICVEDEQIATAATDMVKAMQDHLAKKRGDFECYRNNTANPSIYKKGGETLDDIRNVIEKQHLHPDDKFEECMTRALQIIRESPQFGIVREQLVVKASTLAAEAAAAATQQAAAPQQTGSPSDDEAASSTATSDSSSDEDVTVDILYSIEPSYPALCILQRKVVENKKPFAFAFVLVALCFVYDQWRKMRNEERRQIALIEREVCDILKERGTANPYHIRDELIKDKNFVRAGKLWPKVRVCFHIPHCHDYVVGNHRPHRC